eukprot:3796717-Pleurochrysis_carterae.AAC.1
MAVRAQLLSARPFTCASAVRSRHAPRCVLRDDSVLACMAAACRLCTHLHSSCDTVCVLFVRGEASMRIFAKRLGWMCSRP